MKKKKRKTTTTPKIDDEKTIHRKIRERIKKLHALIARLEQGEQYISITVLRNIEYLCMQERKMEPFALHLAQSMMLRMREKIQPEVLPLIEIAIRAMQDGLDGGATEPIRETYRQCRKFQGQTQRLSNGIVVRIIVSRHLLFAEYALDCFLEPNDPKAGYQVARHYLECYNPRKSMDIDPESLPFVRDIVDYWTTVSASD